jgi:broad-specificity NMP kinase
MLAQLVGHPGTGKRTLATELLKSPLIGLEMYVLYTNHYFNTRERESVCVCA